MNLVKKVIDIDEEYTMYFDMESVLMYKEANKSFIQGYNKLVMLDDETVLDFIACTLRDKKTGKPVGFEFVRKNPLVFFFLYDKVIELIASGFEEDKEETSKKTNLDEDLDEEWLYYAFTTILGKSDKEFLESTPKKICSQIRQHSKFLEKRNKNSNKKRNNKPGLRDVKGETVKMKVLD